MSGTLTANQNIPSGKLRPSFHPSSLVSNFFVGVVRIYQGLPGFTGLPGLVRICWDCRDLLGFAGIPNLVTRGA